MSEKQPEFESSIERNNIRVTYELGRKSILFDLMNTALFEHPEEYRQFDHIFRRNDDEASGVYFFREDFDELYDELDRLNFTKTRATYPTEADERAWIGVQDKRLKADLERFEKEGYDE